MADKSNQEPILQDDPTLSKATDPSVDFDRELTMVYLMLKDEIEKIRGNRPPNHPIDIVNSLNIRRKFSVEPFVPRAGEKIELKALPKKAPVRKSGVLEFSMGDRIMIPPANISKDFDPNITLPAQNFKKTYYLKPVNLKLNAYEKKEFPAPDAINQRKLNPFPGSKTIETKQNEVSLGQTKTARRYRKYRFVIPYSLYRIHPARRLKAFEKEELKTCQNSVSLKERSFEFTGKLELNVKQSPVTFKDQKKAKQPAAIELPVSGYKGEIKLPITPKTIARPQLPDAVSIELKQREPKIVAGKYKASDLSETIEIKSRKVRTKPEKEVTLPKSEVAALSASVKPVPKTGSIALKTACMSLESIPEMISTERLPGKYTVKVNSADSKIEKNIKKTDISVQKVENPHQNSETKINRRDIALVFLEDFVFKPGPKVTLGKLKGVPRVRKSMVIPNGKRYLITINPAKEAFDEIMKEMSQYKEHIDAILAKNRERRKELAYVDNFVPLTARQLTQQWEAMGGPEALREDFLNK